MNCACEVWDVFKLIPLKGPIYKFAKDFKVLRILHKLILYMGNGWLVVLDLTALSDSISVFNLILSDLEILLDKENSASLVRHLLLLGIY